jgi:L-fuculose-phosphate aldolase
VLSKDRKEGVIMMRLEEERIQVVEYGKKLITAGLTAGTGGNLSVLSKETGLLAISPSGFDYFKTMPEDVVVSDLMGHIVEGKRKPSVELPLHIALYDRRADVSAVVHTHSVYATTVACLQWELPAFHYLIGYSGKKVPLAPYATFGSEELAKNVADTIEDYNAVLMANHGVVCVGKGIAAAFNLAEVIELMARIYCQAKSIGEPVILSDQEMVHVLREVKSYGQNK